jgi:hypothetical protein
MITKELSTIGNIVNRTSAKGKDLGVRMTFGGMQTASEIRASLRESGFKGKELTCKVNDVLAGGADIRWIQHEALVSAARSNGFVPDYTDASGKGTGMTTRYIKPEPQYVKLADLAEKDAVINALQEELAVLRAAVLSKQELAALPELKA